MRFKIQGSRWHTVILVATLAFLVFGGTSRAEQFALDWEPQSPDITSSGITITYDAISTVGDVTTGNLSAAGLSMVLDVDGLAPSNDFIIFPNFALGPSGAAYTIDIMLEVDIAAMTIEPTSGTIEILGYLGDFRDQIPPPDLVAGSGTLLTGDVSVFGFSDIGTLEFAFTATGGDLANSSYPSDYFGPLDGADVGVELHPGQAPGGAPFSNIFDGLNTFTQDFSNETGSGFSDTWKSPYPYSVPEPSTFIGLVTLLLASICTVWRRKQTA